jgi:aryl-alcohol dehydrogenase (NADP+)
MASWVLDEAASRPFIARALEQGINFFDTADMYSRGVSEQVLGRALKALTTRDQVVLATKAFYPVTDGPNNRGLSRKHLVRRDRRIAQPSGRPTTSTSTRSIGFDRETPIEETLEALHDIVKSGKARYIGASRHVRLAVHEDARHCRRARLDAVRLDAEPLQPRLPGGRARDAAAVPRGGIGVIPWSPLARGFLAGNRRGGTTARRCVRGPTTSPTVCITRKRTSRLRIESSSSRAGAT